MNFLESFTSKLNTTWDFITGNRKSGSDITAETPKEKQLGEKKDKEMVNFVEKSVSANSLKDKRNALLNDKMDKMDDIMPKKTRTSKTRTSKTSKPVEVNDNLTKATDEVMNAAYKAMKATEALEKANDEANKEIIINNVSVKEQHDVKVAKELEELISKIKEKEVGVATLKEKCIKKAVDDLTVQLRKMDPTGTLVRDTSVITDIAESWARQITSASNDPELNTALKNFIYRMGLASDAFQSQCIFSSNVWESIPSNPPLQPAGDSSTNPSIWNWLYSYVNVGPYRYVVGPILDFQNIEGRVFIYVKCYSNDYTRGTYFWVYRSQSEGLYRIFFKLDTHGSIEKGYDYTQATLVNNFQLQIKLCEYYERHNKRGLKDPIVINTLGRLNYFMSKMSELQAPNFLDSFPGAIIQPSVNSVDCRTGMYVTGELVCDKPPLNEKSKPKPPANPANECCYVCLTQDYDLPTLPPSSPEITQSQGMIGHYYMIDDRFASIITKGFPRILTFSDFYEEPWVSLFGVKVNSMTDEYRRKCQAELNVQLEKYFPSNTEDVTHPHYDFSRIKMGYGTTCPYIFCFTTCSLIASCPMFNIFLNSNYYKKTFWCQGFQNYTAKFSSQLGREILSPVLYVVIGGFLQYSEFALSTLQYDLLNNVSYRLRTDPVFRSHFILRNALMTLGTRQYNDKLTSLYLPTKRPRDESARAFTRIQKNAEGTYESLGLPYRSEKYEEKDKAVIKIVKENVEKKINMIRCLCKIYTSRVDDLHPYVPQIKPFVDEVKRLSRLSIPPVTIPAFGDHVIFDPETEIKANEFIADSPEVAAAALFGYFSNETEFKDDLTDYADICLKKHWTYKKMDDEYRASSSGIFDPGRINSSRLNYLGRDGEFHEFDTDVPLPDPANPRSLYVLKSSFDEVRRVDTSPKNLHDTTNAKKYVKVVTFATIYRRDSCYYDDELLVLKSVSIIYQVSSTFVYTREVDPIILFAKDGDTIPLVCIPDLPVALLYLLQKEIEARITELLKPGSVKNEVIKLLLRFRKDRPADFLELVKKILKSSSIIKLVEGDEIKIKITQIQRLLEQQIQLQQRQSPDDYLNSDHTLCGTCRRVMSYGAFFAGKMMEYFFGNQNSGCYQLPYFFKNFDKFLKVSSQYDTTALIYLRDVSPYNLLTIPSNLSFPEYIQDYFQRSGITLKTDSVDPGLYIREKLRKTNHDIEAISKHVTGGFHVDSDELDDGASSVDSLSQRSSSGHLSSQRSSSGDLSPQRLRKKIFLDPLESSQGSINDPPYRTPPESPRSSGSGIVGSSNGGSLYIKTHNFTYKNKTTTPSKKSRKYAHFKNMIKKKNKKYTTYKWRATGVKRSTNPNKTMRRYRRVRK